MQDYEPIIGQIETQTGITFRHATETDLNELRQLGLREPVLSFYRQFEPTTCAGQVRIWPIQELLQENRRLAPGAYVAPHGYVVFASTYCGDAYCFDLKHAPDGQEPAIVLISHETDLDQHSAPEKVDHLAKPVAGSLYEFLQRFLRGEIDEKCTYF